MLKDYSFLNYMRDENGEMSEEIMHGLIGDWLTNAKFYYEIDRYKYYMFKFDNTKAGVLLKTRKNKDRLEYDDFQPIVFSSEPVKCKLLGIHSDNELCTLLIDDKCLIVASMDTMGFKENDELYVHLNLSAIRIEFRKDENDYYDHLQKTEDGGFNIFNIGIGQLIPPIGFIKGERNNYPGISDELLSNYPDNFMVGSGTIADYYMVEPKLKDEKIDMPNNELPLGKCDCIDMKTTYGIVTALLEDDFLKMSLENEGIKEFEIKDETIVKIYGMMGAFIDIEKTKELR